MIVKYKDEGVQGLKKYNDDKMLIKLDRSLRIIDLI